ncbi:SDR family NAD(P)-dependent oxidoreductase [Telmatobacter bradus]|uniref:SDR family NAD(P)-dependent oxidoreductase n=1 Tax=Telmatobacter bradus TaxID=474953 RepID=UPI003B43645C
MSRGLSLVTGASSDLGAEFARTLAWRKMNLVLVARRAEPMERLADELRKRHEIEVLVQPMDLASPGSVATLAERLDELKIALGILVNNAAFGPSGPFLLLPGMSATAAYSTGSAPISELCDMNRTIKRVPSPVALS